MKRVVSKRAATTHAHLFFVSGVLAADSNIAALGIELRVKVEVCLTPDHPRQGYAYPHQLLH